MRAGASEWTIHRLAMSTLTPEQLILEVGDLYSLPAVAMEVLALARDPALDAADLKASLERDPALAAKVLRVVNSSLFGLAHPVSSLNQAITMLGLRPLKIAITHTLSLSFATVK